MNAIDMMRALIDGCEVDICVNQSASFKIRLSDDGTKIEYMCFNKSGDAYKTSETGTYVKPTYVWKEYPCVLNNKNARLDGFNLSFQEAVEAMKDGKRCMRSEKPWDVYFMEFEDGPLIRVRNYNPTSSFSHIASLNMDEISDKWKIKPDYE